MNLRSQAKSGLIWVGSMRGFTRIISLIKMIIIARILEPSDLGLFGIAAVSLSLLEILTETGVNIVLVQQKKLIHEYLDSAWVVSIIRGTLIFAILFFGAPLIGNFFSNESASEIIRIAAFIPLLRGLINPYIATLQTELLFKKEFVVRSFIFFIDAFSAVCVSFIMQSAVGLVVGVLIGAIAEVSISFLYFSKWPKFAFDMQKIKFVISRGKWLTVSGIMDYFIQNGDNLVVGKLLGSTQLGIYQMSYQLSTLPVGEISNILSKVAFPLFTTINDNKKRLKVLHIKLEVIVFITSLIISTLIFLLIPLFVYVFLGSKWESIIPIVRILCIFSVLRSMVLGSYAYFLAIKKQEYLTTIALTGVAIMFILIFPLINNFGLEGAPLAAILGSLASLLAVVIFTVYGF